MPRLTPDERAQIIRRLNELHEQVQQIVESQELSVPERGQRVIDLHGEWLREFMRLKDGA